MSSRPANPIAEWTAHGRVSNIRFKSSFEAVNPAVRRARRGYAAKQRRARPALAARRRAAPDAVPDPRLHGFGLPVQRTVLLAAVVLPSGYDVLLYTLPFHGRRAERFSPYSGYGYFADGLAGFAEAMAQAVHDFRSVLDYLEYTGVDRVALTGMSLGGYTSALIAGVDDRIQAVIPNVPVVTPESAFDDWFPANVLVKLGNRLTQHADSRADDRGIGLPLTAELRARWCPRTAG